MPLGWGWGLRMSSPRRVLDAIERLNRRGQPAVLTVHPWEIDREPPRVRLPARLHFAHYFRLAGFRRPASRHSFRRFLRSHQPNHADGVGRRVILRPAALLVLTAAMSALAGSARSASKRLTARRPVRIAIEAGPDVTAARILDRAGALPFRVAVRVVASGLETDAMLDDVVERSGCAPGADLARTARAGSRGTGRFLARRRSASCSTATAPD